MIDHPLLLAVAPVVVATLIPQARSTLVGWVRRWWDGRPRKVLRRLDERLTAHLDSEDVANEAMVTAASVDAAERVARQETIDLEFLAVDSRFARVEGRIEAAHAELAKQLGDVSTQVAHVAGAVEALIHHPSSNAGWQGGR